jgi:energy-coupling factor transporter ATP-binding protein EcfA2
MSTRFDRSELHEVLKKPTADKVNYFEKKRLAHPMLVSVRDQLCSTITLRAGVDLAIVTGPTGVGKSTLIDIFRGQVEQGQIDYLRSDPGCVPVVIVEAPAPETSVFGWKDFYVRIMEALGEPLIGRKVDVEALHGPAKPNLRHPSFSTAEMRRFTEKSLRNRKTSVLIVDEAQHMLRTTSGRKLLDCLETLNRNISQPS